MAHMTDPQQDWQNSHNQHLIEAVVWWNDQIGIANTDANIHNVK